VNEYQRVWKLMIVGKLVVPTSPTAKVDGEIHGASKKKWVLVDQESIPKGILEELNQAIAAEKAEVI
jgi:hypothetical protein